MSFPVEKLRAKMDDMRIPGTIYSLLIEKYFDQADNCAAALAGCGTLDGIAPLYYSSRFASHKYIIILHCIGVSAFSSFTLFISQELEGLCHQQTVLLLHPIILEPILQSSHHSGLYQDLQHKPCLLASRRAAFEHNLEDADA